MGDPHASTDSAPGETGTILTDGSDISRSLQSLGQHVGKGGGAPPDRQGPHRLDTPRRKPVAFVTHSALSVAAHPEEFRALLDSVDRILQSWSHAPGTLWVDSLCLRPGDNIGHTLLDALEQSLALVVLLSPGVSRSIWCPAEIEAFQRSVDEAPVGTKSVIPLVWDVPDGIRYDIPHALDRWSVLLKGTTGYVWLSEEEKKAVRGELARKIHDIYLLSRPARQATARPTAPHSGRPAVKPAIAPLTITTGPFSGLPLELPTRQQRAMERPRFLAAPLSTADFCGEVPLPTGRTAGDVRWRGLSLPLQGDGFRVEGPGQIASPRPIHQGRLTFNFTFAKRATFLTGTNGRAGVRIQFERTDSRDVRMTVRQAGVESSYEQRSPGDCLRIDAQPGQVTFRGQGDRQLCSVQQPSPFHFGVDGVKGDGFVVHSCHAELAYA